MPKQFVGKKRLQLMRGFSFCVVFHGESPKVTRQGLRQIKSCETTDFLARPLAATKFEIRISKYETISNDKKLNAPNFT